MQIQQIKDTNSLITALRLKIQIIQHQHESIDKLISVNQILQSDNQQLKQNLLIIQQKSNENILERDRIIAKHILTIQELQNRLLEQNQTIGQKMFKAQNHDLSHQLNQLYETATVNSKQTNNNIYKPPKQQIIQQINIPKDQELSLTSKSEQSSYNNYYQAKLDSTLQQNLTPQLLKQSNILRTEKKLGDNDNQICTKCDSLDEIIELYQSNNQLACQIKHLFQNIKTNATNQKEQQELFTDIVMNIQEPKYYQLLLIQFYPLQLNKLIHQQIFSFQTLGFVIIQLLNNQSLFIQIINVLGANEVYDLVFNQLNFINGNANQELECYKIIKNLILLFDAFKQTQQNQNQVDKFIQQYKNDLDHFDYQLNKGQLLELMLKMYFRVYVINKYQLNDQICEQYNQLTINIFVKVSNDYFNKSLNFTKIVSKYLNELISQLNIQKQMVLDLHQLLVLLNYIGHSESVSFTKLKQHIIYVFKQIYSNTFLQSQNIQVINTKQQVIQFAQNMLSNTQDQTIQEYLRSILNQEKQSQSISNKNNQILTKINQLVQQQNIFDVYSDAKLTQVNIKIQIKQEDIDELFSYLTLVSKQINIIQYPDSVLIFLILCFQQSHKINIYNQIIDQLITNPLIYQSIDKIIYTMIYMDQVLSQQQKQQYDFMCEKVIQGLYKFSQKQEINYQIIYKYAFSHQIARKDCLKQLRGLVIQWLEELSI